MKFVAILVLLQLAVLVRSETCTPPLGDNECNGLTCQDGWNKACVNNVCTCNANTTCLTQAECTDKMGACWHSTGWHCVDNNCYCGRVTG